LQSIIWKYVDFVKGCDVSQLLEGGIDG